MKRLLSVVLASLILIAFSSCAKGEEKLSEHISQTPVELSALKLDYDHVSVCAYKNIVFALKGNSLVRYDLATGENTVIAVVGSDYQPRVIGCSGYNVAVIDDKNITVYDYDGNSLSIYPHLISDETEIVDVAVSDDYVIVAGRTASLDSIVAYNYADKDWEPKVLSNEWKPSDDARIARLGVSDDGVLYVNSDYGFDFYSALNNLCEIRISSGNVKYSGDTGNVSPEGCFGRDGVFYALDSSVDGDSSLVQFIREFDREDLTFSDIVLVDNESLYEKGVKPAEIEVYDLPEIGLYNQTKLGDDYSLEYADGSSFTIYNDTTSTLVAFTKDESLKPLTILIPANENAETFRIWAKEYMLNTGRQVVIDTYPPERYIDNMYTKLMAEDDDYDIFFADPALLKSILDSSMYVPLNDYEDIVYNFDNVYAEGIRELMSVDGNIFGIPMEVSILCPLDITDDSYSVSDYPTVDELFELCESLKGSGKKAFRARNLLSKTIENILNDMIYGDGDIDEDRLAQYLEKFKSYNDAGVLCDGDTEAVISWGVIGFDYLNLKMNEFEGRHIVASPTVDEHQYLSVNATALINKSSQNIDAAAGFMAILSGESVVYDNANFGRLFGRDVEKNSSYSELSEGQRQNAAYAASLFENSRIDVLDAVEGVPDYINEVIGRLFDGDITPQDAAKKLKNKVARAIFE